jgi:hypothetical protein
MKRWYRLSVDFETIARPFEVQIGREGDRLVRITIRAAEGTELGLEEIREATKQILDYARRQSKPPFVTPADLEPNSEATRNLVRIYEAGRGRVTDEYLAALAIAYGELVPQGRNVSMRLATLLGKPTQTVKGHLVRARQEGFLTDAVAAGREGGEPTPKALSVSRS